MMSCARAFPYKRVGCWSHSRLQVSGAIFGLPDERLAIRHDAGVGAMPYVGGTLLAVRSVMTTTGLMRGLDRLLFRA